MITLLNVVSKLQQDNLIVQSYVYSYRSKRYWRIEKPLDIKLSNGKVIHIQKGFYYDMATVPKWLWSIARPFNDGLIAYLIHDHLYVHREHGMTRREADREMLIWANRTNPDGKLDNTVRYYFVRLFGGLWWNS